MTHVPHELHEEFPDQIEMLTALKTRDPEFAAMMDRYHVVNRMVHRAEANIEPTDDIYLIEMRKERLALKDKVAAALHDAGV